MKKRSREQSRRQMHQKERRYRPKHQSHRKTHRKDQSRRKKLQKEQRHNQKHRKEQRCMEQERAWAPKSDSCTRLRKDDGRDRCSQPEIQPELAAAGIEAERLKGPEGPKNCRRYSRSRWQWQGS